MTPLKSFQSLCHEVFFSELGYSGLYKAPIKEKGRKRNPKRREGDQIKFIDLMFERGQVVRVKKGRSQERKEARRSINYL